MLLTFNWYFTQKSGDEWIPPTGHSVVYYYAVPFGNWSSLEPGTYWVQDTPGYMTSNMTSAKLTLLADNYTNQGIVTGSNWFIDVKHPFIVSSSGGSIDSPTLVTDIVKLKKMNCLHYRDQTFRLFFDMTNNFVTDTANQDYFQILDSRIISYYNTMVNKYYPPFSRDIILPKDHVTTRDLGIPNNPVATPAMTDFDKPSGLVSSSCPDIEISSAWVAFDQEIGQSWEATLPPVALVYDFDKESKIINKYSLQNSLLMKKSHFPSTWTFEGSNNENSTANDLQGTNGWKILDARTNINCPTTDYGWTDYFTFSNNVPYQKYRIYITRTCGNTGSINVILSQLKLVASFA